jgi:hypothetical protein
LLKVGYTEKDVEKRVAHQYPTKRPDGIVPYKIVLAESAMRNNGTCDHTLKVERQLLRPHGDGIEFSCT